MNMAEDDESPSIPKSTTPLGGAQTPEAPEDGAQVTVRTDKGELSGKWLGGVARFAAIPFAEPPVGDLRFRPPVAPLPWEGVRDATVFGPICPQNPSMMDLLFGGESETWDEDCLYLNVWTSDIPDGTTAAELRPVMVWIHGGGFEMGSGSSPLYRGDSFARDGVVYVSINYRLGSLGFLELGGLDPDERGSANVGLLDQIAALEWVRDNIAQFGGDPSSVTVFGESAGAMSVSLLLASPLAEGLFQRAITQSGAASAYRELADADRDTREFLELIGVDSIEGLRAASVESLLKAHAELAAKRTSDPVGTLSTYGSPLAFLAFRPVADGRVVPLDPIGTVRSGSASEVALLSGTNLEEWKLFSMGATPVESEEVLIRRFGYLVDDPQRAFDAYTSEYPDATLPELECAFMTDTMFRIPADDLAAAQLEAISANSSQSADAPSVYQYRFDWRSGAFGGAVGAAHAVEIPFVFDMLGDQRLHILLGMDAPRALSELVHRAWVAFAATGDPSRGLPGEGGALSDWVPSTAGIRVVQVLDTTPVVLKDPNPIVSEFWRS